jgi:hypothetical protein
VKGKSEKSGKERSQHNFACCTPSYLMFQARQRPLPQCSTQAKGELNSPNHTVKSALFHDVIPAFLQNVHATNLLRREKGTTRAAQCQCH